jgi:RNA polymerase sigma factor (sigma-70 family)
MNELQDYVGTRSQQAFAAVVDRYADLVYAAALRHVNDRALAEDITQGVFALLARKAARIPPARPVSAWLLTTTRYIAMNERRLRANRRKLEQTVAAMNERLTPSVNDQPDWSELGPLVDEGLSKLRAGDRDVLMLRYFECQSLRDVARAIGTSEEAASKRVQRALERLRMFFQRRGITAADVSPALMALSSIAAPAALRQSLAAISGKVTAGAVGGVLVSTKLAGVAAALMIAACAVGIVVSTRPATTAPVPAAPTPSAWANPDEEKTLRAAKDECFSKEVCDALIESQNRLNSVLVTVQQQNIMSQTMGIDADGRQWVVVPGTAWDDGQGMLQPGNTTHRDLAGIFLDSGALLPLQRVRTEPNPGRITAKVTEPWRAGEPKNFYWMMREAQARPGRDGRTYGMWMSNRPGRDCMQQLGLVLSRKWKLRSSSEPATVTQKAGEHQIYFWHRQVSAVETTQKAGEHQIYFWHRQVSAVETQRVDLVLERTDVK